MADVAKVVDFGLVKEIASEPGVSGQVLLGTAEYLAPERITDPELAGPGVDLYALGAVAFFLLTGRRVFEGTAVQVCIDQVSTVPSRASEVAAIFIPPELDAIVARCLAKKPVDRYASARALADALAAVPVDASWDRAAARAWWAAHARDRREDGASNPAPASAPATLSIDLDDLDERELRRRA